LYSRPPPAARFNVDTAAPVESGNQAKEGAKALGVQDRQVQPIPGELPHERVAPARRLRGPAKGVTRQLIHQPTLPGVENPYHLENPGLHIISFATTHC